MLLGEPARTGYDWNFRLLRIPIRVHPLFWATAVILGLGSTRGNPQEKLQEIILWVLAVFLSILVHELGHALCFACYRINSHVVLYHFGGLAIPDSFQSAAGRSGRDSPFQQIMISAAGPGAQIGLALVVILLLRLGGYTDGTLSQLGLPPQWTADPIEEVHHIVRTFNKNDKVLQSESIKTLPEKYQRRWREADKDGDQHVTGEEWRATVILPSPLLVTFISHLLFVSIFWALLNLVPVYPLDGGQITRELFLLSGSGRAIQHSLILSIAVAVGISLWGFLYWGMLMGVMFLLLAYSSYTTLQRYTGRGGFGGGRPW